MTRQLLQNYKQIQQALPSATNNFVRDYSGIKEDLDKATKDIVVILEVISDSNPLFGVGSPEGVTVANLSQTYYDTTLSPASVTMYINENVGSNTGWVVVA